MMSQLGCGLKVISITLMSCVVSLASEANDTTPLLPKRCEGCSQGSSLADVIAPLIPAIVRVSVKLDPQAATKELRLPYEAPNSFSDGLKDFFNRFHGLEADVPTMGYGSGFIIDPNGYIVTNRHVIARASQVCVTLHDQREFKATVVGQDTQTDIALLKISTPQTLPYLKWGDSRRVRVCDTVIAVGTPYGLGGTITRGVISHIGRTANMQYRAREGYVGTFFQTDAAINPGNSGGPLLNDAGEVIGINTAMCSGIGGGYAGLGLSIPGFVAQPVVEQLRRLGHVRRGWLGVYMQDITPSLAGALMLKKGGGVLVSHVVEESPAYKAGIRSGDAIVKINGQDVMHCGSLVQQVALQPVGSKIQLTLWRKTAKPHKFCLIELSVHLGENIAKKVPPSPHKQSWGGIEFQDTPQGVMIAQIDGTRLPYSVLGCYVLEVDSVPIERSDEVIKNMNIALKIGKKSILMLLKPSVHSLHGFYIPFQVHNLKSPSMKKTQKVVFE